MKQWYYILLCSVLLAACARQQSSVELTILHTNDTHSQVEPRQDNTGGYARRMGLISQERQKDPELILLDAGDFCQGTPYYNYLGGEVEIAAMNRMGYDAATIGNHEFDNGVNALAEQLKRTEFDVVCANYRIEKSPLEGIVKPYTILNRKGLKIGVTGVDVNPEALVTEDNFSPLAYESPFEAANKIAKMLKKEKHCDVVICLSHLGTDVSHGDTTGVCDVNLAAQSRDIDLIIGGHTHRAENRYVKNRDDKDVLLVQTGKSGVRLGKVTLIVE